MDPLTIGMLVILAVLVFFMFRNSRKRKADQEALRSQIVPGAEVMTNFGLYGTLISMDDLTKVAELETAPGHIVRVHSQTIAKVVEPENVEPGTPRSVEEAMAIATREEEERERARISGVSQSSSDALDSDPLDAPQYGERTDVRIDDEIDKPAGSSTKKTAE